MNRTPCPRESAVLRGLTDASRPAGLDGDLQGHLRSCPSCRDVAALVETLRRDRAMTVSEPVLPTASQIWWRARVRSRLEAAHAADRPISLVQSLSIAALAGLAVSLVGAPSWLDPRRAWTVAVSITDERMAHVLSGLAAGSLLWLAIGVGACLALLMPVAAAVALSRD